MAAQSYKKQGLVATSRQSPPLSFPGDFDASWLASRTIIVTGGASGLGAAFVRHWASAGATVVFGDINHALGKQLEESVRRDTGQSNVHFEPCDVTQWADQVRLFRATVKHSPHGGIDAVVANAGVTDQALAFERPGDLDAEDPPAPDLKVLDVNLSGVAYTVHLALFHLGRNPGSAPADPAADAEATRRDRHLLLIGSMASFGPIALQALYGASKHGVAGFFRSLRMTSFAHGLRVNLLAPYFVDTPMMGSAVGKMLIAGAGFSRMVDVVEAATRLMADVRIVGRALCVGTKLKGDPRADVGEGAEGEESCMWEVFPDDLEDTEIFTRNIVRMMNMAIASRGWVGWAKDVVSAVWTAIVPWGRR